MVERPVGQQTLEQLLDEQRDAVGVLVHEVGDRGRHRSRAQTLADHLPDLCRLQRGQLDQLCDPPLGEHTYPVLHPVGHPGAHRGHTHHRAVGETVGEVLHDGQGLGIRPVQVLQHQQTALLPGDKRQQPGQPLDQGELVGLLVLVGRTARHQARQGGTECRQPRVVGPLLRPQDRQDGFRNRAIGGRGAAVHGPPGQHRHTPPPGRRPQLVHQPCLADPGRAQHPDEPACPAGRLGQRLLQELTLGLQADQRGTADTRGGIRAA